VDFRAKTASEPPLALTDVEAASRFRSFLALTGCCKNLFRRHCEEQSDEATQESVANRAKTAAFFGNVVWIASLRSQRRERSPFSAAC
jgi:hypothetical protein